MIDFKWRPRNPLSMPRVRVPELMDDPNLPHEDHSSALAGLHKLNDASNSAEILWRALHRVARKHEGTLRVLDIATGSGDMPIKLAEKAQLYGVPMQIDGCDISDFAVQTANHHSQKLGLNCTFFQLDVVEDTLPETYDVIMTSLFTHHLDPEQVVSLLNKMSLAAQKMVIVSDLVRSKLNLALVSSGARILTDSHVVHFDASASVRAAYTIDELKKLAEEAGLAGVKVEAKFPCRMLLTWKRKL